MPVFRHFQTRDLGELRFTTCFQDSKGWMWLGSDRGLWRFDGLTFSPVQLPDSLEAVKVRAIQEFDGQVWVGFENGRMVHAAVEAYFGQVHAEVYKKIQGFNTGFKAWSPPEGLTAKPITGIVQDGKGGLWFSTYGEGVYVWKNNRMYQFGSDDGLGGDEVYCLAADQMGQVWAATDGGISICAMHESGQKTIKNLSEADGLPDEVVTALYLDFQGNMLIGTHDNGFCKYVAAAQKIEQPLAKWPFGEIKSITAYGPNVIWIGTAEHGPVHYDAVGGRLNRMPASIGLSGQKIIAQYKDREGLLWLVSDKGQLFAANVRFNRLPYPFPNAQALLVDRQKRLWAGSPDGLYLLENERFKRILPQKQNVLSLWESPSGDIWVGTFGNGVMVLDEAGNIKTQITEKGGLGNGSVLSVAGNAEGVWLATLGGVSFLPLSGGRIAGQPRTMPELGNRYVYKVFDDSKGRVWFGTDGQGLGVLENGQFRNISAAAGAPLKTIYSIAEDRRGHIWFSTEGEGLFRFDGIGFQRFTTANRMHHNTPAALATAGDGCLVLGYAEGLDVMNPDRLDHFNFFDADTGVPVAEVNLNAMCSDGIGNVWIGTREGIFRRNDFGESFIDDPQPNLTSVSVFLQPFDFQRKNVLQHDENYLVFNFSGLWYTNPKAVRFRYKLDGFDPDWKESKDDFASYPNLPPGRYTFRLQASEHGNFEHVEEAAWAFVVEQPFWTRWWFVLLALASGTCLIWWFVYTREARLRQAEILKKENVESQFAALKSQINPHFLFNSFNTLITIIEENPPVAVEYVEHLSDFYRSVMVYRERDFISLQEELELVQNFNYLLKKRFEDNFRLHVRLDDSTGFIMPFALQMLVENAVKHNVISAARPLSVEIFAEDARYIVVRNNIQRKTSPEPSTHFGLKSLMTRYQLLGERPVIIEDNVAFFTVKIPIRNSL